MAEHPPGAFEPVTIPELQGGGGPIRVTLRGAPGLRPIGGGAVRPVAEVETDDGEGGVDVVPFVLFVRMRAAFACGSYVMKLKDYLPRLIYQCRGCQLTLTGGPGEVQQFEFEASSRDRPPFRVQLDASAVVCPRCGQRNVLWSDETAAAVEAALTEAVTCPTEGFG